MLTVLVLIGFSLACSGFGEEDPPPVIQQPTEHAVDHQPDVAQQSASDWFFSSRYEYCDAKLLAGMWGDTSIGEAKDAIGGFLRDGEQDLLESKLGWAREAALANSSDRSLRCTYSEIGFSFEDAVALGELWGIDSWDAKLRIEEKYLFNGEMGREIVRDTLNSAQGGSGEHADPFEAYVQSRYEYCDAVVMGGLWGVDPWDAKSKIGYLLREGSDVDTLLREAQLAAANNLDNHRLRCDYDTIGYSYDDAEALGALWGIDTWDAKVRIEEKYLRDGHNKTHIDDALRQARVQRPH